MRQIIKRILSALLAMLMLFSVAIFGGCGPKTPETPVDPGNGSADDSTDDPVDTPPETPVVERKTYSSVILVGIDGMGAYLDLVDTPNIDRIFADGLATRDCLTETPTISAQCWGSMLTGVVPTRHGFTNDIVENTPSDPNAKYPTIFKNIKEQLPEATLAAFCHWTPIYDGIIEHNLGVVNKAGNDESIKNETVNYLETTLPTFLFLQLDEVDAAGHSSGYGSQAHLDAIARLDGYVGEIYDALQKREDAEDVLFIVATDHGGFGTSHGGQSNEERYVFFGVAGETIAQNSDVTMRVVDIPAIVAYALNIEGSEAWNAQLPVGIFADNMTPDRRSDYHVPVEGERETPEEGDARHISNYLDEGKLRGYLTFDCTIQDDAYGLVTKINGKETYSKGILGEAFHMYSSGSVSCPELEFGTDSFSIACWIQVPSTGKDPVIYGNKDWNNGKLSGFVLSSRSIDFKFNVGDGSNRQDMEYAYPEDHEDRWFHTVLVVDREENRIYMYVNFQMIGDVAISDALISDSFDSGMPFTIGADGKNNYQIQGKIDDFIVYGDAMTPDEVASLGEYYQ